MAGVWDGLVARGGLGELLAAAAVAPAGSYLFVGPPGVGKADAARRFGAAVLCERQCGQCGVCTRVIKGVHPDLGWFQPEGMIYSVDTIREIARSASHSPLEGKRRVIVVEEADRIPERSQNALLKALEEPADTVTWVLLAEALDLFLPTVLSRCHVVGFPPIPEDEVMATLEKRSSVSKQDARAIVRTARGDLERSAALASDEDARKVRVLAVEAAAHGPGSVVWALGHAEEVIEHARRIRSRQGAAQEQELAELAEVLGESGSWRRRVLERNRRTLRRVETAVYEDFLFWLGTALRDLVALSAGSDPGRAVVADFAPRLEQIAPARSTGFWLDVAEEVILARLGLRENANAGLIVESLLLALALGETPPGGGYNRLAAGVAQG